MAQWVVSEYVLVDSNSIQLLYIGSPTLTRTTATAPSRRRWAQQLSIMNFAEKLEEFIHFLETTEEYAKDMALQRVVKIMKETKTQTELTKSISLINRISLDSVENWATVEKITSFLKSISQ